MFKWIGIIFYCLIWKQTSITINKWLIHVNDNNVAPFVIYNDKLKNNVWHN